MMNAIFCRQCGDKLDLDSLKLEDQLGLDEDNKASKASQRANQIVGAVLAFVIVVLIAALLIPPTGRLDTSTAPSEVATGKLKELKSPAADGKVEINEQDLTDLLNKAYGLPKEGGDDFLLPAGVSVCAREDGTIKVVMKTMFYGFLPLHTTFTCKPVIAGGQKGNVEFEDFSGISLGWIPAFLPADVTDEFVMPFRGYANDTNNDIGKAKKNVTGITVQEGKIVFDVARKAGKKKAKKAAAPAI